MVGLALCGVCPVGEGKDWAQVSGPGEERRGARMCSQAIHFSGSEESQR